MEMWKDSEPHGFTESRSWFIWREVYLTSCDGNEVIKLKVEYVSDDDDPVQITFPLIKNEQEVS
jgi:hypothetical protein